MATIGIDLGTTNSAMYIKEKDLRLIQNSEAEDLTPSVVSKYKGATIIGSKALGIMEMAPEDTIVSVKRLMGRAFKDKEVQKVREKVRYKIVQPSSGTEQAVMVIFGGEEKSPIDISAMILEKLKKDAEMKISGKVEYAVITVPAYFTDKQRHATRRAGIQAGLKVKRILDEPTAAAVAFGVDNVGPDESKKILVYDLGGGTFDVSILDIVGGTFAVHGTEGDMWLGGDDFDYKIMDYVLKEVKKEHGIDGRQNSRFMAKLKQASEKAKKELSAMPKTEIFLPGLLQDSERNIIDVIMDITREQFVSWIEPDIDRSIEIVNSALANGKLKDKEIDHVLLVGGSTMIPLVKEKLIARFGKEKILMNVDPMKVVAQGAGIMAKKIPDVIECFHCGEQNPGDATKCINEKCGKNPLEGDEGIIRVTAIPYGIQTTGDKFDVIIEKGTPYPTEKPKRFSIPEANLRRLAVPVYAGHEPVASANEHQVTAYLLLPKNIAKGTPVDVIFELDSDQILQKIGVKLMDGSGTQVDVFPARGGDQRSQYEKQVGEVKAEWNARRSGAEAETIEKIEALLDELYNALNDNKFDKVKEKMEAVRKMMPKTVGQQPTPQPGDWKTNAQGMVAYSEAILQAFGNMLSPQQSYKMTQLVGEVKKAISEDNKVMGEKRSEELQKELQNLPPQVHRLIRAPVALKMAEEIGTPDLKRALEASLNDYIGALQSGNALLEQAKGNEVDKIMFAIFEKWRAQQPAGGGGEPAPGPGMFDGLLESMKRAGSSGKR